ncbi:hypothetical protein [Nonomuraea insulae]|uniref:Uncharacterized protein n=1 Tax=Nonomuraea insulae TaxID=1616787 RepID=A0ABW1CRA5_9ACTN
MKSISSLAAVALAAATALAPAAAAHADTPYAQAAVQVGADGDPVGVRKNVVKTWRESPGLYCVVLHKNVNLHGPVAILATAAGRQTSYVSLSVSLNSPRCDKHDDEHDEEMDGKQDGEVVAVQSLGAAGSPRDTAFFLIVS